jgi:N-acetylglucosamine kinase-like BadF-type ATPase
MLARDALKSICRAHDGRAPETRLTDAILKELLLETPTELIGWMTQLQGDKSREAALSRVVLQVAEEGDATAHAICKHHAGELALMAETVRKKLFSDYDEVEILPGGGNLEGNAYYRELFTSALAEFSPAFKPQESRGGAAIGALILSAIEYQKKGAYHPTQAWAAIDPDKLGAE